MPKPVLNGQALQTVYFSSLTIEKGLSSNNTSSIIQDKYGFIWIGTEEGLNRYDGFKITHFKRSISPASLSSNRISTLLYDDDVIWIGTWDGLNTIDIHTFEVKRINTGTGNIIRTLFKDKDGDIWIGTTKGLLVYRKTSEEFKLFNTENSELTHNTIRSFYQAVNGDMWIGTYDGLNKLSNGKFTAYDLKEDYKPMMENNLICTIHPYGEKSDSLLWVGTETGLALFNSITGKYTLYNSSNTMLSNEVIKCIYPQNDSLLWLGTDFGLNIFNTVSHKTDSYYHDPLISNSIVSNVIWEIFEDRQKRLWLITTNGISIIDNSLPIYQLHEEYFSYKNPRIGNLVKDILISENEDVWLATIHGVMRKQKATGKQINYSTTSALNERILLDNVYSLKEDIKGRIWIGTAGGINIWDNKKMLAITANKQNGLISNYISNFTIHYDGSMWVTAWEGGIFKVNFDENNLENMSFTLVDNDGDGRLISAGEHLFYGSLNNLWHINHNSFEKTRIEKVSNELHSSQISSLMAAIDGTVWVGAENLLIHYFPDKDSISKINVDTGRPQRLLNLQEDLLAYIWMTTPNSIIRIDKTTHDQLTIPILKNSPLRGFYQYSSTMSKNGNIFYGGDNAYIKINPKNINLKGNKPDILISGLQINNHSIMPEDTFRIINRDISFVKELSLKHNQNSLTLEFTTLDYLYPEITQFAYRLLPFKEQWTSTAGEKNFAVFANLKPGRYYFEVKGTNHLGTWSNVYSLPIYVKPSIWLSKGFVSLYLLLIVFMTYFIFKIYNFRHHLKNELKIVKLEKQHSEKLYRSKIRFFTNISHEFRTPLSLIIPPIQELLKTGKQNNAERKMLLLANRNAQRLYKLVNQLLDFRKMESSRLEITYVKIELISFCKNIFALFDDLAARNEINYNFSSTFYKINLDADKEKLETILFNLLSNAFKYTPVNGQITFDISQTTMSKNIPGIQISIKDSGIGISEKELPHIFDHFFQTSENKTYKTGSGIGLTLAQEYAKLHDGIITVSSQQGKGSEFSLSIPIIQLVNTPINIPEKIYSIDNNRDNIKEEEITPLTAKRILIVDDNEDILDLIYLNLKYDYHIFKAKDGREAMKIISDKHPHMVISDIIMPVMDGYELCKKIKTQKSSAHIPVILLSARSLDLDKTEGMERGADMYITKPFDIEHLRSCIRSLFRRNDQIASFIEQKLLWKPANDIKKGDNSPSQNLLKKVIHLIENNLVNPDFSVETLSRELGMSSTHLYRKLKNSTGFSTNEIITNYRMQKAAMMIENEEGNITEIMYAVGFSSLSTFSRSFKNKFGFSPKAYQNRKI